MPRQVTGASPSSSTHANVSITLDVYSHAVPTLQREAARQVADLVVGPS